MILAIDALQVAMAEKNIAKSVCPAYQRFFAFVIYDGTDIIAIIRFAITVCTCKAVGMAIAGAKIAVF